MPNDEHLEEKERVERFNEIWAKICELLRDEPLDSLEEMAVSLIALTGFRSSKLEGPVKAERRLDGLLNMCMEHHMSYFLKTRDAK